MTPAWFTEPRRRLLEREYPAGVPWVELHWHLVAADPDAPPVPGRRAAADLMNGRGFFRPAPSWRTHWSDDETATLRALHARGASRDEYTAALPGRNWHQLGGRLRVLGLAVPARPARVRHPPAKRMPALARNVELRCLCCRRPFMSWDRRANRLCPACPGGDVSHAVDAVCIVRLRA